MNELILILIPLLIQVESGGDPNAIGDNGKAVGCLQIWPCVVQDVNRISGKKYSLDDRYSPIKSKEMCLIYLNHYGKYYQKQTGKKATLEVLARCWNGGGPSGWKKKATESYWKKVKELME